MPNMYMGSWFVDGGLTALGHVVICCTLHVWELTWFVSSIYRSTEVCILQITGSSNYRMKC